MNRLLTLKNVKVDPLFLVPYAMAVCLARSSADSMGDTILSTVRKAARLAVYEDTMMRTKNHQIPPTILNTQPHRIMRTKNIPPTILNTQPHRNNRSKMNHHSEHTTTQNYENKEYPTHHSEHTTTQKQQVKNEPPF
jgi:hypothetical protein